MMRFPPLRLPAVVVLAVAAAWLIAATVLPRGLPAGIVVAGVVSGGITSLAALGIVVVYRATGIVNLAQGQLGALGALAALLARSRWQAPWLVAVVLGLLVAAATGATVHLGVFRRLRNVPLAVAMIATVGVAELDGGLARLMADLFERRTDKPFAGPLRAAVHLHPTVLSGDHLVAVTAVAACGAALTFVLWRTDWGRGLRAVASNRERAAGVGVSVDAVLAATWAVAGALSTLALLLQAPIYGLHGSNALLAGGTALLLRSLAAAVIAGMTNVRRAALAAVALGVVEQASTWSTGNTTVVDLILVLVILVALFGARSRRIAGGDGGDRARRTDFALAPAPLAPAVAADRRVRTAATWGRLGLVAFAVALPLVASPAQLVGAGLILVYALLAVSVVVVVGWAGHLSLGQFAIAGLGGATAALLFGRYDVDLFVALAAACVVGALIAVAVGLPALRLPGPLLAVTTLALAVASSSYLLQRRHLPQFVQDDVRPPVLWGRVSLAGDAAMYLFCLASFLFALWVIRNLERTRLGRTTAAVRDNPRAAAMAGLRAVRVEVRAMAVAGALAGFAGGLYVIHQRGLHGADFTPQAGIQLLAMAAIGGLGSVPGAVAGAVVVQGAHLLMPAAWTAIATGTGVLVFLLWFPEGIAGVMAAGRDRICARLVRSSESPTAVAGEPSPSAAMAAAP